MTDTQISLTAAAVAPILSSITGETWQFTETTDADGNKYRDDLTRADGLTITFGVTYKDKTKIAIYGNYRALKATPLESNYGGHLKYTSVADEVTSIMVSRTKEPEKVALDIVRRLLPGIERTYAYLSEKCAGHIKTMELRKRFHDSIVPLGAKLVDYNYRTQPEANPLESYELGRSLNKGWYGSCRYYGQAGDGLNGFGTVSELTLNGVPYDKFIAILAILEGERAAV